jgi:hypothetical protein
MKKIAVFLALMLIGVANCYGAEKEVNDKNFVRFEIDMTYSNLTIEVYNNDTNAFIERVFLNKDNKIYYYNKGLNIRIVETTSNSAYEKMDDIILKDESKIIDFNRQVKNMNVTFKTIYRGYGKYIESVDSDTDITIYDENFNEVSICKSESSCEVVLPAGKYFIKDNKTGRVTSEIVKMDRLVNVSRYFIDGIFSEEDLKIDIVTRKGKLYYFDKPAYPEEFEINGEICDFSDSGNYLYIFGEGIFYKYNKKDEVIDIPKKDDATSDKVNDTNISDNTSSDTKKDDITSGKVNDTDISDNTSSDTKKDDILDEEIYINVPDTQTNSNDIIYFKKKYYF